VTIRVRPGAPSTSVGGAYGGALVVRVSARAVAGPFGVRRRAVTLVTGATSRTKVIEVAGGDQAVLDKLLAR
jgi:uncharacterized protein YggU (UPF0235/DUF167 family)